MEVLMESYIQNTGMLIILFSVLPIFIGARSCIRRGNGLLAIGVGLFTFSICNMCSEVLLPIPLFPPREPLEMQFVLDRILPNADQMRVNVYEISTYIVSLCYFLLFSFFLCVLFRSMRKLWKGMLVIAGVVVFCFFYTLLRTMFYDVSVYNYSIVMWITGLLVGYLSALALTRIFPDFFKKLLLAEWPKRKDKVSFEMDLD